MTVPGRATPGAGVPGGRPSSTTAAVLDAADAMGAEIVSAAVGNDPSAFWADLNARNRAQIADAGFDHFKRTVNQNYFNWTIGPRDRQWWPLLVDWLRHPSMAPLGARIEAPGGLHAALHQGERFASGSWRRLYALFVALLWDRADRESDILERVEEPDLGDPLTVRYRGRSISQDLANSALEHAAIAKHVDFAGETVIELGGGYGRLAWLLLETQSDLRVIMVDIPPALAIAQEYLTGLYPSLQAFRFRHFDNWNAVASEIHAARIVFLTPNQLDMAPPLGSRLFINVSSLHEMTRGQIAHYFAAAGRHASYFYTKQWRRWQNPLDRIEIGHDDYPVPAGWRVVFDRPAPVQKRFFEALYEIR